MTFRRLPLALSLALACAGTATAMSGAARAEAIPQVSTSTQVTGIVPTEVSPTQTRVVLTFSQTAPAFSIITNNNEASVVAFADTKMGPAASAPTGKHGLVEALSFAQNDSILTLTLTGSGPLHIVSTPLGGKAIALDITAVPGTGPKPDLGTGHLAPHADAGGPDDVFEVVSLKYADVSEVVGLLTAAQGVKPNDNFNPQEPAFGSAGMSNGGSGVSTPTYNPLGANGPSTDSLGQAVDDTIGIDRRLNAIILRGPASRVTRLKDQIAKLDVPVSSVILETIFVELTANGARNLGINLNNANNQIATVAYSLVRGTTSSSSSSSSSGSDTDRWGSVNIGLQAAISAEIQKGEGRIISKPRIAAQSGSTAKIITGDALPIQTSIALSGVNAVQQQVQYVNVGVTLQIAPRVSDDGFVTSHIFAEVSSVTGYSGGYPTISQREASTMATVKDGDSFVIGGLTQDSQLTSRGKTPLLGDIPGVGELFKFENGTKAKTDLYIIVTPHIVHGRDEAAAAMARTE
jgi:general secretion pathway protein D